MQKYQLHTNKNLAVIQWNEAFKFSDVQDALEELPGKAPAPILLFVIDP